jgi:hypothetical protein
MIMQRPKGCISVSGMCVYVCVYVCMYVCVYGSEGEVTYDHAKAKGLYKCVRYVCVCMYEHVCVCSYVFMDLWMKLHACKGQGDV